MKKALVAYDFSPYSRRALGLALQGYPFGRDIELEVLHVVDEQLYVNALSQRAIPTDAAIEAYFAADVARIKSSMTDTNQCVVRPTLRVRRGHPYQVLLEQLEESHACGLWIGGQGHDGPAETILGSTARRVLQHSHCSVYVTKQRENVSLPGLALCAVDLHAPSVAALRETDRIATQFRFPFSVIHVIEASYAPYLQQQLASKDLASEFEQLRTLATDNLVEFEKQTLGSLKAHTRRVVLGKAREEILNEASALIADTIVVGTKARKALAKVFLGSVAEGLLDRAEKDVYVVRADT